MTLPCAGLNVVELALGVSDLGLGMAGGVPGMVLADLGAKVVRVVDREPVAIDRDVAWGRAWHRDKQLVAAGDDAQILAQLTAADIALVYGSEARIEQRGLGFAELSSAHPALVYARCRPSRSAGGELADYGLLVEAQAGFCSQLQGHRPGPIFVDVRASGAGAAFIMLSSVLALLRRRALSGRGGASDTSLYDGMLATLGTMIGRSERAPEHIESYWAKGSTFPNFMYRCAGGELLQVWFGGKGMYEKLIQVLGDDPSTAGYYAEQVNGLLQARAVRWRSLFTQQTAAVWMERLRAAGVACEPVLAPGEALSDPHLTAAGIARVHNADVVVSSGISVAASAPPRAEGRHEPQQTHGDSAGCATATAPHLRQASAPGPSSASQEYERLQARDDSAVCVTGAAPRPQQGANTCSENQQLRACDDREGASSPRSGCAGDRARADGRLPLRDATGGDATGAQGLLAGVRVLDFSAFVAGPLSAQILADLGADVIKVEPPEGEAMRAAAYAIAACQRGKRSIAIDITGESARPVIERLIAHADVVLHNFRVGVSSRLGIDQESVARINPSAVYCHSSAFGPTGPRAKLPGNDALMQALTGFEHAIGGAGNDPIAATWIPIDMAGGWIGAIGVLAGLYARAQQGCGQVVDTSLLGAGMLLQSGVFQRDGVVVRQPELDAAQSGYGPGYRLYECRDGKWLAVVIESAETWQRIARLPECSALPRAYVPLRRGPNDELARAAECVLAAALRTQPSAAWLARLREQGALVAHCDAMDRDQFRKRILDDPYNRELGRVVAYPVRAWGHFEQLGSFLRVGPEAQAALRAMLPDVGEHSASILQELGFDQPAITKLLDSKVVRQL
jgi:crotonobetainyl-CoA:carnitine CoA-transferase CaiB-like acyl-CoA transferase